MDDENDEDQNCDDAKSIDIISPSTYNQNHCLHP